MQNIIFYLKANKQGLEKFSIWLLAAYFFVFYLMNLIAVTGPPLLVAVIGDIDQELYLSELVSAVDVYVKEVATTTGENKKNILLVMITGSITYILFILCSIFFFFRKRWARYALVILCAWMALWFVFQFSNLRIVTDYIYYGFFDSFAFFIHIIAIIFLITQLSNRKLGRLD